MASVSAVARGDSGGLVVESHGRGVDFAFRLSQQPLGSIRVSTHVSAVCPLSCVQRFNCLLRRTFRRSQVGVMPPQVVVVILCDGYAAGKDSGSDE
jgi:hypothetical protein